jgi:hypothetical protein
MGEEGRTSRRQRKKGEMLFAHLKRILNLDRRGPNGAPDEFHLAATARGRANLNAPGVVGPQIKEPRSEAEAALLLQQ